MLFTSVTGFPYISQIFVIFIKYFIFVLSRKQTTVYSSIYHMSQTIEQMVSISFCCNFSVLGWLGNITNFSYLNLLVHFTMNNYMLFIKRQIPVLFIYSSQIISLVF